MISFLNPDKIVSQLFYYHSQFHFYHLQTKSYAQHKNLNDLYEFLEDSKDNIAEYLLGVIAPKRFSSLENKPFLPYSEENVAKSLDELFKFTIEICDYAKSKNWEQLCNLASELQGAVSKSKYFNTFNK